jgi:hypothetical protein
MATELFSNPRIVSFILSEASAFRSRENGIVTQTGTEVKSGTLLTKVDTATTGSAAATAGNTGNPTFGTITVGAAGKPGAYKLTFTAATKFDVEDPDGVKIGSGTTGVAFSKSGVGFTLTAGGTPAVAGDEFTITVATGTGKYIPYTAAGAAGPADGICYTHLPAATGDAKAVVITDDCEVNRALLTGLDATGEADLRKRGIKVRGTAGLPTVSTPAL